MADLKFSRLAFRIHVIGNRRPAQTNRLVQHAAHDSVQPVYLPFVQICAEPPRMYSRAPQALVRIDIAHSAQNALIEQQRFDVRAPRTKHRAKFLLRRFQRVETQLAQHALVRRIREHRHSAKAANIRVTKFPAVIQRENHMRVRRNGNFRQAGHDLSGHTEVNQKRRFVFASVRGFKLNEDKFAVTPNGDDAAAWELQLQRGRIVDEIRLAQADVQDAPARQYCTQTANDRFDFRQLRHISILRRRKQRENANRTARTAFEFYRRRDQECSRFGQLIEIRKIF